MDTDPYKICNCQFEQGHAPICPLYVEKDFMTKETWEEEFDQIIMTKAQKHCFGLTIKGFYPHSLIHRQHQEGFRRRKKRARIDLRRNY